MNNKAKVYLAGGMKSGWQDNIIERFKNKFIFFNPRDHKLDNPIEYTLWDLHFVKESDILFAFMEKENPSGFGLTLELGFAKALNKTIILVDERSAVNESFANRFKIVRESSSVTFNNIEDGIKFLDRFGIYST